MCELVIYSIYPQDKFMWGDYSIGKSFVSLPAENKDNEE